LLKDGKFVLGTWCELPSPAAINVMAKAGLDFIIIDMEHGAIDFKIAQEMVMASEADGCEAFIRVSRLDESDILRSLDIDPAGIVVPHVETVEDCLKIIEYSKFPPVGKRGFNPYIRAGSYHGVGSDYFTHKNNEILLCIILEGTLGFSNLDKILELPEIDVVYIGAYDLSVSLGVPGDVKNSLVIDMMETAIKLISKKGKAAGCMIHNINDLILYKKMGVQFILYKVDTGIIYESYNTMKMEINKWSN